MPLIGAPGIIPATLSPHSLSKSGQQQERAPCCLPCWQLLHPSSEQVRVWKHSPHQGYPLARGIASIADLCPFIGNYHSCNMQLGPAKYGKALSAAHQAQALPQGRAVPGGP